MADSKTELDSVIDSNGRGYHAFKAGQYFLPNDLAEQQRLDLQHSMWLVQLDGLYLAPLTTSPKRVLDVATGTGIWAIQFAEKHPTSHITGTDLSAIQPAIHPSNCTFVKEDSEELWKYQQKFDYIHLRMVFSCFQNPRYVLQQAIDNLEPGGWIEYHDLNMRLCSPDGSHEGTAIQIFADLMGKGLQSKGRDPDVTLLYKDWLYEAGLVDVVERTFDMPASAWSHDPKLRAVGKLATQMFDEGGHRGMALQLFRSAGLSDEETEAVMQRMNDEYSDTSKKIYMKHYAVYGRKPIPRT